jgi:hypothetical protein
VIHHWQSAAKTYERRRLLVESFARIFTDKYLRCDPVTDAQRGKPPKVAGIEIRLFIS